MSRRIRWRNRRRRLYSQNYERSTEAGEIFLDWRVYGVPTSRHQQRPTTDVGNCIQCILQRWAIISNTIANGTEFSEVEDISSSCGRCSSAWRFAKRWHEHDENKEH
jgi:hypothetical protein